MLKLRNILVLTIIISSIFIGSIIYVGNKTIRKIEQVYMDNLRCQRQLDSIRQEIFVWDIQLARYEYMMSIVETENPKLYKKIMDETE